MNNSVAQAIAGQFDLGTTLAGVQPHGNGLINDTFLVTTAGEARFILQRLNAQVFPQPERILENLHTLLEHARGRDTHGLRLPALIPARDGRDHVRDDAGGFWRLLEFIPDTRALTRLANPAQARAVGAALGTFHALLDDLPVEALHTTLPGFHVTPAYLARFDDILLSSQVAHSQALTNALAFVEERRAQVAVLEDARAAGVLRTRPTHGDPKLDNFLFDATDDTVVALIDLDTVQPGLVQVDVADCLRSCCNRSGDTPTDPHAVRFDLPLAQAILQGYLTTARDVLEREDADYFYEAIRLIPFELGLRFLTDHFAGDVYFKVAQPGQNLQRALAQFRLAEDIERHETTLRGLIASLAA
jgi:Ser/Thr protein kinase RdoA (MazF antagonist)